MLNGKRSQAALEFLMTYGWAILVVLIVISALAYFGVLNPQRMLPSRCTMPTGFSCQDFVATQSTNEIKLNIVNGIGTSVTIHNLALVPMTTNSAVNCTNQSGLISNGQTITYTFPCTNMEDLAGGDQKYRWSIIMEYYASDSTVDFMKTVQGELLTTVES